MQGYDDADWYDCLDRETFTHESPEEAIEERLDLYATPGCDMQALVREHSPLVVNAHARDKVTEQWLQSMAIHLADALIEAWEEDFGDPDGGGTEINQKLLVARLEPVVREVVSNARVWQCSPCGSHAYLAEEVEAMMREHRPDWFEESRS